MFVQCGNSFLNEPEKNLMDTWSMDKDVFVCGNERGEGVDILEDDGGGRVLRISFEEMRRRLHDRYEVAQDAPGDAKEWFFLSGF